MISSNIPITNPVHHTSPLSPVTCPYMEQLNSKISFLTHTHPGKFDGPNCWGTATYLLGIIPTFRFVCETEFKEFLSQATTIPHNNPKTPAVLCIWNNINESLEIHHVALRLNDGLYFEKAGPEAHNKPEYKSLETILAQAETNVFSNIPIVDSFDQGVKSKYSVFLDFSAVQALNSSTFENKLDEYHRIGQLRNLEAMKDLSQIYRAEIGEIQNPRELSLAEGFLSLLNFIEDDFKALLITENMPKETIRANRFIMAKSENRDLRNLVGQVRAHVIEQISDYSAKTSQSASAAQPRQYATFAGELSLFGTNA